MLTPALSLHPGPRSWDGAGSGGDQRPWYGRALAVLAAVVLLGLLSVLLYLLLRPGTAREAGLAPPPAADPGTGGAAAPRAPHAPGGSAPQLAPLPAVDGVSPSPLELTGEAARAEEVPHDGGLLLVRMAHRADGPFSVELTGAGPGGRGAEGPIADATGNYQGTRAVGLPAGSYTLEVEGSGWWGVTVERPRYETGIRLPHTLAGAGDTATRPFEVRAPRTVRMVWTVEADGTPGTARAALRVRVLDAGGDVVARFDARHGGETGVDLDTGVYLLDVTTTAGIWRVSLR